MVTGPLADDPPLLPLPPPQALMGISRSRLPSATRLRRGRRPMTRRAVLAGDATIWRSSVDAAARVALAGRLSRIIERAGCAALHEISEWVKTMLEMSIPMRVSCAHAPRRSPRDHSAAAQRDRVGRGRGARRPSPALPGVGTPRPAPARAAAAADPHPRRRGGIGGALRAADALPRRSAVRREAGDRGLRGAADLCRRRVGRDQRRFDDDRGGSRARRPARGCASSPAP